MNRAHIKRIITKDSIQMYGGTCPECGFEVFTSAFSSIVMCPQCDTGFAIDIPPPNGGNT